MIGKASFHCGSHAQRLMDAAEIVIGVIDRNHVAVILELLGERVRESRESPHSHPEIQILSLDVAGRNVIPVNYYGVRFQNRPLPKLDLV